jgi:hypothetical protein
MARQYLVFYINKICPEKGQKDVCSVICKLHLFAVVCSMVSKSNLLGFRSGLPEFLPQYTKTVENVPDCH